MRSNTNSNLDKAPVSYRVTCAEKMQTRHVKLCSLWHPCEPCQCHVAYVCNYKQKCSVVDSFSAVSLPNKHVRQRMYETALISCVIRLRICALPHADDGGKASLLYNLKQLYAIVYRGAVASKCCHQETVSNTLYIRQILKE